MEPSGVYGDPLHWLLDKAGIAVFRVNPKRSHDAAEVYDGVPSLHDAKSATIVARLHLDGASEPWPLRSDSDRAMAAAVQIYGLHHKQFLRHRNQLEALTARHWPEVTHILDLDSATLLELLIEFGGPEQVAKRSDDARQLMQRVGGRLLAAAKVEAIVASAQSTVGMPPIDAERVLTQQIAQEARRNQKAVNKHKRRVERLTQAATVTDRLQPVVGKLTSAVLVVSAGDPTVYPSASAYIKALGLNLKEKSSGKQSGQLKITKRGPSLARLYLYLAALRLIQNDAVTRAWYRKKVDRQGGKLKTKAIVAVMRKLAKGLWHVAHGSPFDTTKLFDIRRLKLDGNRPAKGPTRTNDTPVTHGYAHAHCLQ